MIKDKFPPKTCCFCGASSSGYIVFMNGFICKKCQKNGKFEELKKRVQ
jgi:hypothetical protein